MPEGVTFFRSYYEAAVKLNERQRLMFYDAIVFYAFEGVVPDFQDDIALDIAWTLTLPNLDNSIKHRENGKKGGRPRKDKT